VVELAQRIRRTRLSAFRVNVAGWLFMALVVGLIEVAVRLFELDDVVPAPSATVRALATELRFAESLASSPPVSTPLFSWWAHVSGLRIRRFARKNRSDLLAGCPHGPRARRTPSTGEHLAARQLRASDHPSRAVPSGLERLPFRRG